MPPQEDINKMNKKIYKLFAKTECYNKSKKYKIYHRFHYGYNGDFEKTDFENMNFLTKLSPFYQKDHSGLFSKSYPRTASYICDSEGRLIAKKMELWELSCQGDYSQSAT